MGSTTAITRNCAIAAGCAAQHDTGYRADSLRSLVGLAAGLADVRRATSGFRPIAAGLSTCRRAPGNVGLPAVTREALPGFQPVADVPGLPPGWSLGKRCRRAPGWSRSACRRASRRAGLPDVPGFRPVAGLVTQGALPTCAGQRRASGRHSEAQGNGQGVALPVRIGTLLARLRPSLPCSAWGIDSREEGT